MRPDSLTRLRLLLCSLAISLGCGGDPTDPDPDPVGTITNVRGRTDRTVAIAGQTREFVVYVGSSVGANQAVPVVFMFHGTSGDGPQFYDQSGWKQKADAEGFIAVFPSALSYCFYEDENKDGDFVDQDELKVTTKWTHGDLGDPTKMPLCSANVIANLNAQQRARVDHPLRDDVSFVDAMITFLKANYRIDEKAIYSTGFSNGAQFSNRLGIERSNVFAATAAHAGGTSVPTTNGRLMSVVSSIGTLDDRILAPLGIAEIPIGQTTLSEYPILAAVMVAPLLAQQKLTQAFTYTELTISGKKVGRWVFSTSTSGGTNSVTFVLFDDNYHTYPNGSGYPIIMANLLWDFFKTQRLP